MTILKLNFIIRQGQMLNIQLLSNRRIRQVYTKNCIIPTIMYIEQIINTRINRIKNPSNCSLRNVKAMQASHQNHVKPFYSFSIGWVLFR